MTVVSVQDKFRTYTSKDEITNQVCNYVKLLKPYYYDICERVYLARSVLRYPDKNGYKDDYAKDNENNSLLKGLVEEIKKPILTNLRKSIIILLGLWFIMSLIC